MEIELPRSSEIDKSHPNYKRWEKARRISYERGKFVQSILSSFTICQNLRLLDIGSGLGETAGIFAKNNFVVSIEKNPRRLREQIKTNPELLILGDAVDLPLKEDTFDIIILQDCIEHILDKKKLVVQLYQLLKDDGIIYLSTPNKYSLFNIISDPHWGLPIVSILKRENAKKYFLKHLRKKDLLRDDTAELLSLRDIKNLFGGNFKILLNTKFAVRELMNGNKGLIWSNLHLKLLKVAQGLRLQKLLNQVANDKIGTLNRFITPTFYIIMIKKKNLKIIMNCNDQPI